MYEDRLSGLISNQKFKELSGKCEAEQTSLSERLEILQRQIESQGIGASEIEGFVRLAELHESPTKLDRELLNRLIDSIEIGDRIKDPAGNRQSITVNYKFIGKIA